MITEVLFLNVVLLTVSIIVLVRSSIYVTRSLGIMARFLGISKYTISLTLMALATTLPELSVGINAAVSGNPELSLGNILGSNIVNIALILGLIALVAGKIYLNDFKDFVNTRIFNFMLIFSPVVLLLDGTLSRFDGVVLILFFLWSFSRTLGLRKKYANGGIKSLFGGNIPRELERKSESIKVFHKNLFIFVTSVTVLVGSSYFIVYGALNLSVTLGLPEILIGVLVIAIGTSLPELTFGIRSAIAGKGDMSLGDLLGASVINSTLILGVTSIISPIRIFEPNIYWTSVFFMFISIFLVYYFLRTKHFLVRKEGIVLILIYIIFLLAQGIINIF